MAERICSRNLAAQFLKGLLNPWENLNGVDDILVEMLLSTHTRWVNSDTKQVFGESKVEIRVPNNIENSPTSIIEYQPHLKRVLKRECTDS